MTLPANTAWTCLPPNLNNEYRIAHEVLGMSLAEIAVCNRYAAAASFIPEAEKRAALERYSRDGAAG